MRGIPRFWAQAHICQLSSPIGCDPHHLHNSHVLNMWMSWSVVLMISLHFSSFFWFILSHCSLTQFSRWPQTEFRAFASECRVCSQPIPIPLFWFNFIFCTEYQRYKPPSNLNMLHARPCCGIGKVDPFLIFSINRKYLYRVVCLVSWTRPFLFGVRGKKRNLLFWAKSIKTTWEDTFMVNWIIFTGRWKRIGFLQLAVYPLRQALSSLRQWSALDLYTVVD